MQVKSCRAIWLIIERAQPIWTSWVQFEERVGLYNFLFEIFWKKILWWQDWIHRSFLKLGGIFDKNWLILFSKYIDIWHRCKIDIYATKKLTLGRIEKRKLNFVIEEWLKISTFLSSNQKGMEFNYVIRWILICQCKLWTRYCCDSKVLLLLFDYQLILFTF